MSELNKPKSPGRSWPTPLALEGAELLFQKLSLRSFSRCDKGELLQQGDQLSLSVGISLLKQCAELSPDYLSRYDIDAESTMGCIIIANASGMTH